MRELQLEIETQGRLRGATGTSFGIVAGFIQRSVGPTGTIFSYELDDGLRNDTTIFFDVGFVVDGYCSDWGRSLYFGASDTRQSAAYTSLQSSVVETIEAIEVGHTRLCDLYTMIEQRLDHDGFGDYLRARLPSQSVGHQIGIGLHEVPWLEPQSHAPIAPGMVFCMEPKLWNDGEYYMRVEDMVLVSEKGAESLTTFDRELFGL
jgi:Xaa-Pro aminopeptidase